MVRGLAHVCFLVRDLEASEAFYRDVLGLRPAFDFVNDEGERFGVYLHVGHRTFVELFSGDHAGARDGQSYQHFCLEVDDVAEAVRTLRARGVDVTDPYFGSDRSWQAWLSDPDGNRIELHGYTPESRQLGAGIDVA
ncbi:MAG TPA: VOC family protein [Armatimonadota bacterium]|nr:VOC family protein [Armatimonadota bacterium]